LINLERARDEQQALRVHAERIADALMQLAERGTIDETITTIMQAFCRALGAQHALTIAFDAGGAGAVLAATSPRLSATSWRLGPTFERALARGRPIAGFDAAAIPEWREQPEDVLASARSTLLVPLASGGLSAVIALVHTSLAAFDAGHVSLARRLIPAATKALSHAQAEDAEHRLHAEIERANERLLREIEDRTRLEEELMRTREAALLRELQEKADIIEHQRAAIRALSTPIIEVGPGILCLPVVGFLDRDRSAHLTGALLEAVSRGRARAVIVDITGIDERLDTDVVGHLVRIAGALRLLGAECVFTGVRASIASAIVEMGLGAGALVTRRRVRDALERLYLRGRRATSATSRQHSW
jgi:rsbT co-antagonist protein RsbR